MPRHSLTHPDFINTSAPMKYLWICAGLQQEVYKYYAAFCMIEALCIMSGLGFSIDKESRKPIYNSMRIVNIRPLLPLITVHEFSIHWNIQTHLWLKYYVMLRLVDRSAPRNAPKNFSTLITFVVSSIWHGVYPGYIVFFVACGILTLQTKIAPKLKVIKAMQRSLPLLVCQILSAVYTHFMVSYWGLAFLFLESELFNKMFVNYHWIGHWIIVIATTLCFVLPTESASRESGEQKSKKDK